MLNSRAPVAAGGATSAAAELVAGYLRELGARSIVVIAENLAREQVHKVEMLPTPDTGTGSYLSLSSVISSAAEACIGKPVFGQL